MSSELIQIVGVNRDANDVYVLAFTKGGRTYSVKAALCFIGEHVTTGDGDHYVSVHFEPFMNQSGIDKP